MGDKTKLDLNSVNNNFYKSIKTFNLHKSDNPIAIFVTGVSGSGKSTMIDDIEFNALKIQPDNYRKLHPRINQFKEKYGRDEAYKRTSKYSFEFAKALRNKAIEEYLNVIYEATFSKVATAQDLIKPFIENGYQVVVVKLPIDVELSIQRNISRYAEKHSQEHTIPRITSREDIEKMADNYDQTLNEVSKQGIKIINKAELKELLIHLNKNNAL
ncbi:zeta toxin family protein [Lonepinella sp. MS14435]|uniref:zeta toxin family protein n=1 Tax=Lonepinella sp. MS14435 TaxID=3003618 RepID=UPI0036DF9EE2